jgi:hypothetical protein
LSFSDSITVCFVPHKGSYEETEEHGE